MTITPGDLLATFEAEGLSIREWSLARGYKPRTVYAVIRGELKARRGVSHRIAVELGLKEKPAVKRFAA